MRKTRSVSVFPVAFSGGLEFEGPICENEKATAWQAVWQSKQRYRYSTRGIFYYYVQYVPRFVVHTYILS